MTDDLIYQPEKYWDRLFAPGGHVSVVTSIDKDGRVNAASYATSVRIVHNPVQIAFTTSRKGNTGKNIEDTGEFVVNLPAFDRKQLEATRVCGLPFEHGVNELEKAELTAVPSQTVKPPRILEFTRHFECELVWIKEWLGRMMIVGNVKAASVHRDMVNEKGYILWDKVKPVSFCGAPYVNMFAAQYEVMEVGMPYEGPEVGAADESLRSYFEDM